MNSQVDCNCSVAVPVMLGAALALLAQYALDKALPSEEELSEREALQRQRAGALHAAKSARASLPRRSNGAPAKRMSLPARAAACGW